MPALANPITFARAARVALVATGMILGLGSAASGQSTSVNGSIGVSLTILQPVATQPLQVVGFDVDRNGLATLQTTAATSAPVSQIVMARVTRESSLGIAMNQASPLTPISTASARLSYLVDLGAPRAAVGREPIQLRLRYLTVAGT